jgi:hypothetical protein
MKPRTNPKTYTPDQVAAKQDKAVRFLRDVVGDDDKADEIEDLSLDEYAERKKLHMSENPAPGRQKARRRKASIRKNQLIAISDLSPAASLAQKALERGKRRNGKRSIVNRQSSIVNPDGAAEMYRSFHGKQPREVLEYQTGLESDRDLAALGDLIELDMPDIGKTINFARDGVVLAANPEGTQLFAVGGNQDLSRALDLADDPSKEFIDFGPIDSITYRTRKSFDQFRATDYVHELGEEGGEKPRLVYSVPAKQILFVGGEYRIAEPAADGVSPGIVN